MSGVVLRVKGDNTQVYEALSRYDATQQRFVAVPIDLGPESDQVFLILYGTGWRYRSSLSVATTIGGQSVETLYAGLQGDFVGWINSTCAYPARWPVAVKWMWS